MGLRKKPTNPLETRGPFGNGSLRGGAQVAQHAPSADFSSSGIISYELLSCTKLVLTDFTIFSPVHMT